MKALLLRMWYALRIPVLIVAAVLLILNVINPILAACFLFAAAMLIAGLPLWLLVWDEKSRFDRWRLTLPVSRRECVDAVYLIMLIPTAVLLLWSAAILLQYNTAQALLTLSSLTAWSLLIPALSLPFAFRFGKIAAAAGMILEMLLAPFAFLSMIVLVIFFTPAEGQIGNVSVSYDWYELLPGPVALILFGISRMISVRVFRKCEF